MSTSVIAAASTEEVFIPKVPAPGTLSITPSLPATSAAPASPSPVNPAPLTKARRLKVDSVKLLALYCSVIFIECPSCAGEWGYRAHPLKKVRQSGRRVTWVGE